MSLILEALNKAEANQAPTACYSTPQAHSSEKKTHAKWIFILLIIIACLTSIIVTLLIFNKPNSSNETAQLKSQNTEYSTSTAPPTSQQTEHEQHVEHPSDNQHTAPVINHKTLTAPTTRRNIESPQNKSFLEESNLANNREPSLHRLVKGTVQHNKSESTPNQQKAFNTISASKEEDSTNTNTKSITTGTSTKIDRTDDTPQISNISTAPNLQLTDIEVSVHMYSEIPAKRFVYINSTRYGEGSKINNDLFIDEITENGIILNSHNTLYRLPLKP